MIAAGVGALVFVSVLLAFHGWPSSAANGPVPRLVATTTSTQSNVPTLVIGRAAATRSTSARPGASARTAPVTRTHSAPSTRAPVYSDASKPAPASPPAKKPAAPCPGCTTTTPLPPQVQQIIDQGTQSANTLGQQVNDGLQKTGQTVSGVLSGVTSTVNKTVTGH
jgi:hypothetical protein